MHDVALALVDVQMPEIDGFELAELMRGSERTRHVPIIFVTAGAQGRSASSAATTRARWTSSSSPWIPTPCATRRETFVQLYRQRQQLAEQLELQRRAREERSSSCAS